MSAFIWEHFTDFLDGSRPFTKAERDELWDALADLLERCGGRWDLVEDDMEAIKASRLVTDKTSLQNDTADDFREGNLALILIDIEDTFTGTTGLDAFKAVCEDEGIDEDDLAELVTGSGRITNVETFHLWNLYKRVLDFLSCCPLEMPTLETDSIAKSWSKWGWQSPTDSSRWFLASALSGTIATSYYTENAAPGGCEPGGFLNIIFATNLSGSATWPNPDEEPTGDGKYNCTGTSRVTAGDPLVEFLNEDHPWVVNSVTIPFCFRSALNAAYSYNDTYLAAIGDGLCHLSLEGGTFFPVVTEGTLRFDLSDELTMDVLVSKVKAALDAMTYPGTWVGTAGSYINRDNAAGSYSERRAKVRAALAGVPLVVGNVYRLYYKGRFTPASGPVVDEAEDYIEFTFADGMTHLPEMTIEVPTTNGTNTIVLLRLECGPFDDDEEDGE